MNQKLLVLDIDGTLTNSRKEITPRTKQALFEAMDQGHLVMLASGRPTPGLRRYEKELELVERGGYLLSFNGAKVTRCSDGKVLYQNKVPNECIKELYHFAEVHDCGIITYDSDIISGRRIDHYLELEARINGMTLKQVDNFVEYVNFDVSKCLMTAEPEQAAQYVTLLSREFEGVLNIGRSEPFFVEITAPGVDKADTLSKIISEIGIRHEDVICCGDGFNDKTMIAYAGLGVAMENAQEEVKAVADYITASNDADGIAEVVYKFVMQ
jgi:hypothetical protein